jgi:HAD superfamily hydrolase (TIGR01509 family)
LAWNGLPARSEAIAILRAARESGWRTAIATNAQAWYVQRHLRTWDAEDLVDAIEAVSGTDMAKKPAPDVYVATAAKLDVDPTEAVAVEDSDDGLEAARAAGLVAIGLRTRWRSDTLASAAAVIDDLASLESSLGLSVH